MEDYHFFWDDNIEADLVASGEAVKKECLLPMVGRQGRLKRAPLEEQKAARRRVAEWITPSVKRMMLAKNRRRKHTKRRRTEALPRLDCDVQQQCPAQGASRRFVLKDLPVPPPDSPPRSSPSPPPSPPSEESSTEDIVDLVFQCCDGRPPEVRDAAMEVLEGALLENPAKGRHPPKHLFPPVGSAEEWEAMFPFVTFIPPEFVDPVTSDIMTDPVVITRSNSLQGHTFNRSTVVEARRYSEVQGLQGPLPSRWKDRDEGMRLVIATRSQAFRYELNEKLLESMCEWKRPLRSQLHRKITAGFLRDLELAEMEEMVRCELWRVVDEVVLVEAIRSAVVREIKCDRRWYDVGRLMRGVASAYLECQGSIARVQHLEAKKAAIAKSAASKGSRQDLAAKRLRMAWDDINSELLESRAECAMRQALWDRAANLLKTYWNHGKGIIVRGPPGVPVIFTPQQLERPDPALIQGMLKLAPVLPVPQRIADPWMTPPPAPPPPQRQRHLRVVFPSPRRVTPSPSVDSWEENKPPQ